VSNNKSTVIIKKIKKNDHGEHHGGSWKVAYADFVTAMMAFFLLLWLITMTSPEKRAKISNYFKYFSLFEAGGSSILEKTSSMFEEAGPNDQKAFREIPDKNTLNSMSSKELEVALQKGILEKLGSLKDQVIVDIVDEGVRIQIVDKEGSLMFEKGSTKPTEKARQILKVIAENINSLPNKVIIEGHTDALPFSDRQYSNWELSTERASSARRELEANGLDPKRIMRVAGYADTDPLIKDNPLDPRNRRISIILYIPKKEPVKSETIKSTPNNNSAFNLKDLKLDFNKAYSGHVTNTGRKEARQKVKIVPPPPPVLNKFKDPVLEDKNIKSFLE